MVAEDRKDDTDDTHKERGKMTAGIVSLGVYIPRYRLERGEIGRMWGVKAAPGEKAVAGYDEDVVTMAVAAALECMNGGNRQPVGLYFASTTSPYKEKQSAAMAASVLDLGRGSATIDFANSLRAGTCALRSALDTVTGGSGEVMVVASDCRTGAPKGRFEQLLGDGAAAIMLGTTDVIAEIEASFTLFSDFTDAWRTDSDAFIRSGEARFVDDVGYAPLMEEAVAGLLKKGGLRVGDISRIVFPATDARQHADIARKLGFTPQQVQDPLYSLIGNTGTAGPFLALAAALEDARPEDRILLVGYGDGADAFLLRTTDLVSRLRTRSALKEKLERKKYIDYGSYATWRDLMPFEPPSLPERAEPSLAARWRERRTVSSLKGVKCRACGTPQIHPIGQTVRVCATCQSKDSFDEYKFSDKRAVLFTYAVDHLQPTKNPPGVNGVIDFDGGGRLICELTDCDVRDVSIGMPVEMTFRKLFQGKGIVNYFWKAKPVETRG